MIIFSSTDAIALGMLACSVPTAGHRGEEHHWHHKWNKTNIYNIYFLLLMRCRVDLATVQK